MSSSSKCIHQPRLKKKKQTSYVSFPHCSFPGRSNKIPAQPDSYVYIYIYIYIYIKKRSTPISQQLDDLAAVHAVVRQFGEITCWKNWKNLCAGKNSFICIKSILKKTPCDSLPLRVDVLIRLKFKIKPLVCLRPISGLGFPPRHFQMAEGPLFWTCQ